MNFGEQGQYLTDLTFFLVKRALKLFNVKWEGARCPGNVFFPEKTLSVKKLSEITKSKLLRIFFDNLLVFKLLLMISCICL